MLLTIALVFCIFLASSEAVLAAGTAKVVASSGKIRAAADTSSDTKASVKKGDKLDVIASKKDGSGYTWYKVYINDKDTGYIRADLVTVEGTISEEKESSSTSSSTTTSSESSGNKTVVGSNNSTETEKKEETKTEVAVVNVSETDVATAKAKDDVRVRKGAGTNFDVAGQAKKDTEVTVSGVASDSEGKNWYQVSFNEGDKTVNGFIREDFLEVLTYVEVVEEEPEEEVVEEEPVVENNDYHLSYMQNDAGEMDWYLFDNINGTTQSLTQILNAVEQLKTNELEEAEQVSTMRLIIFALAAVVVILIITVTILIFKLRDAYEYEYEDDEEDDEEDEDEEDAEEEEEDDEEEEEEEVKAPRKSFLGFGKKKEVIEEDEDEEEEEEIKEIKPVKTSQGENKAWQSKDFLELDDDMEFEFLDL